MSCALQPFSDVVEYSTDISLDDTSVRHKQLINYWATNLGFPMDFTENSIIEAEEFESFKEHENQKVSRSNTPESTKWLSLSSRNSTSSLASNSDMPFQLPFDIYDFVDDKNLDPMIEHLKSFIANTEHSHQDWTRVIYRNNREVIRFFSLHAEKISEEKLTDACECLMAMLDINFAQLTPGLVTSAFIRRSLEGLSSAVTPNDLHKRLQLCHSLYVYGGSAFPLLSLNLYIGLVEACNHQKEGLSAIAQTTLIIVYYRAQSDELWNLCHQHLSEAAIRDVAYRCLSCLQRYLANEMAYAACSWIQKSVKGIPTRFYNEGNFFSTVDILLDAIPNILYNEEAAVWYFETLAAVMEWSVYAKLKYKDTEIIQLLNYLLEQGQDRNYSGLCESVSEVLNTRLQTSADDQMADDLCIFE